MEEIAANSIKYLTFSLCKVPVFIHELFIDEFITAITWTKYIHAIVYYLYSLLTPPLYFF